MQTLVELRNIQKKMDDFELGPIDFTIEPGTITALVGNNGSGKSTLLKLMMHLVKPDKGTIELFHKRVGGEDESWKKHVAYQAQTPIGYNAFNGEALRDLVSRWYPNWDDALFMSITNQLDVSLKKRFGKMSQGAQQKLTLALTIASNTNLLILDEPTSFLDIPSKRLLFNLLVSWMEQDTERSIILASHQSEDIKKLADYITVVNKGKMHDTFEKETLTENYQRYWFKEELPFATVPGEINREDNTIVTNRPSEAEVFFNKNNFSWMNRAAVDLDDVITMILTHEAKR
ncbi:ATP-binding cassette domain-containing protein [Virgibacillus sp. W0181]|uniref:ATP-binding cassette domain-containing protein n=1 Tax=Virgibacillus sp. W0181 TaxID=3391581 RepID=UPI003F46DBD6